MKTSLSNAVPAESAAGYFDPINLWIRGESKHINYTQQRNGEARVRPELYVIEKLYSNY